MQAVAASAITIPENPNISNEHIGEVVMIGLKLMGYTTFSDEEVHFIADACTIIATARDTYKQLHPEVVENDAKESEVVENDSKESETIKIIYQKNEYPS